MIRDTFMQIPVINPENLERRLKAIEEGIASLKKDHVKSIKDEWLSLPEFMEATGVRSHYSISKMEEAALTKGRKFKSKFLGKRRYIHVSEVDNYFAGELQ